MDLITSTEYELSPSEWLHTQRNYRFTIIFFVKMYNTKRNIGHLRKKEMLKRYALFVDLRTSLLSTIALLIHFTSL